MSRVYIRRGESVRQVRISAVSEQAVTISLNKLKKKKQSRRKKMSKLQHLILAVVLVLQASSAWGDVSDNNAGLKVARQTQSINSYYNSYNPYNAWRPWNYPYYPYQQYYQPSARIPRNQQSYSLYIIPRI